MWCVSLCADIPGPVAAKLGFGSFSYCDRIRRGANVGDALFDALVSHVKRDGWRRDRLALE